jgi:hypothetical protein
MRRRTGMAVAAIALAFLALFALVPLVHTTTRPPIDQLAFLGIQPATESISCAVFGVGAGYWETATPSDPQMRWSYQIGCPPSSSTPGVHWTTPTSCSSSVATETTGTFFPYFTQTTTYAINGTTSVTRTLTAGETVVEYSNRTVTTCG